MSKHRQIPTSFKIKNKKWDVSPGFLLAKHKGWCHPSVRLIAVNQNDVNGHVFSQDERCATFWHEVTHAILADMNSPLWTDEKFVNAFSDRLYEIIKTARF